MKTQRVMWMLSIVALAGTAGLACKSKQASDKAGGSAAAGSGAGTAAGPAVATSAAPADPARTLVATASDAVAKLVPPAGAGADARIGQAIDATVEATRGMAREAWDPAAVVAAVGKDRKALFTWVRDRTALVPYRGSLRGAVGVMMDRVGNSLDRALLLAELLKQAGLEVRLATGPLEPDAAGKLAASWSTRARPPLPVHLPYDEAAISRLVASFGIDAAAFTATTAKLDAAVDQLDKAVRARIAAQTAAIAKLVPAPAAPATPDVDPSVFAEHWWVQVQDEAGWSDLDPTLPDANPGEPLANATETLAPDELADDRRHTIAVRVIGEVWHGDAREETTLVEHAFAPSLFYGQRIVVTASPLDLPDDETLLAAPDPAAAATAALIAQTEWIPVIQIGDRPVVKMSVTDGGELYDVSAPDANTTRLARAVQRATKQGVGAATGLLDTLPDEPGGDVAPQPVIVDKDGFTAEWIEVELRAPGAPPRVVRRQVFDAYAGADRSAPVKLTDAARLERALALCGQTELLPMFARIPEAFVTDRAVKALVAARPLLVELAPLRGKPVGKPLRDRLAAVTPVPGAVYALALARFAWSGAADQVYLDRLGLLAEHRRTVVTGKDVRWRNGFDIMANDVSVWPAAGIDARATRLAQGVADTAAEAYIAICPGGPIGCMRAVNTSDEFAASGTTWKVIAPGAPADALRLPAGVRALAEADLAAGYAIIVPSSGVATWWRVHPATGEALGMGPLGGNTTVEQIVLLITVGGLGGAACMIGSHSSDQMIDCMGAVGFGAIAAYGGIEYAKRRILTWATSIVAGLLGIRAAGE